MPGSYDTPSVVGGLSAGSATDPHALRLLGEAVAGDIRTPDARTRLRRAWVLAPACTAVLLPLEIAEASAHAQRLHRRRRIIELSLSGMHDIANRHQRAGEDNLAERWIGRLLAMAPQCAGAEAGWNLLGALAYRRQQLPRARLALRRALVLAPEWPDAHSNLSEIERVAEDVDGALRSGRRAVSLTSDSVGAYNNLGLAMSSGQLEDGGARMFRCALALSPTRLDVYANMAHALLLISSYVESARWASRGLALDRESHALKINRGYAMFCLGELNEGFAAYELRHADQTNSSIVNSRVRRPKWQGEPLAGKTILIWGEQGIGDQFFFGRYLQFIDSDEAHVVLEVEPRLVAMFKRAFPRFEVVGVSPRNVELFESMPIDVQIAMGSLPGLFLDVSMQMVRELDTGLGSFEPAYLEASAQRRAEIAAEVPFSARGKRVAVSWRGGFTNATHRQFYMSAAEFAGIFEGFDGDVVNVQYGHTPAEIDTLRRVVRSLVHPAHMDLKNDLEGVAAILSECDLLVTASTAVCWLGAALGVPVWNFLTGWQWFAYGTQHCPAFPNARFYWRRLGESWDGVIDEIRSDLIQFQAAPAPDRHPPHALAGVVDTTAGRSHD